MIQNQWQVGKLMESPNQQFPQRKFKLIKQLGSGSEGIVFEAQSINWDQVQQKYALKIHFSIQSDAQIAFIDRLIEYQKQYEQPSIIQSNQSFIIRTYERFHNVQNQLVLVMEIGTCDFYEYLKNSNLNLSQIRNYCIQMTKAINFIHSNGYMHRDLKHENFIIVGQDVKMIDFGQIKYQYDQRMTQNVGSPIFQAPEVKFGGVNYTSSIDIWSLGCVIYETIKKEPLFNYQTAEEVYQKLQQCMIDEKHITQSINQLQISEQWKQTLCKMLQIKNENRPKIQDVLQELEKNQIDKRMNFLTQSTPNQNFPNISFPNQNQTISFQIKNLLTSLNNPTAQAQIQQNNQTKQELEQLIQQSNNVLGRSSNNINQQKLDLDALSQNKNLKEKVDFIHKIIYQINLEENNQIHFDLATKISELHAKNEAIQLQQSQLLEMQENINQLNQQIESQNQNIEQIKNQKKQYQELQAKEQALMNLEKQLQQSLEQLSSSFVSNEKPQQSQQKCQINLEQRKVEIQEQQEKIFGLQQELNKAKMIEKIYQENLIVLGQLQGELSAKKELEESVYQQSLSMAQLKIELEEIEKLKIQSQQQQEEVDKLKNQIQNLQFSRVQFQEKVFQQNELKSQLDFLQKEMKKFSNIDSELQNLNNQLKNKQSELEQLKQSKEEYQKIVELKKQQIEQELQNQLIELREKKIQNLTQEIEKLKQPLNQKGNQQQEKIDQLLQQKNNFYFQLQTQQLKQQKEQDLCFRTDGDIQFQQQQNNFIFNQQNQIKNQQFNVMQTEQVTSKNNIGFPNQNKDNF